MLEDRETFVLKATGNEEGSRLGNKVCSLLLLPAPGAGTSENSQLRVNCDFSHRVLGHALIHVLISGCPQRLDPQHCPGALVKVDGLRGVGVMGSRGEDTWGTHAGVGVMTRGGIRGEDMWGMSGGRTQERDTHLGTHLREWDK